MKIIKPLVLVMCTGILCILFIPPVAKSYDTSLQEQANASLVRQVFDDWKNGRGSVFDLLADNVEWTVAGSSPVSGTYRNRQEFIGKAVQPINSRLSSAIVPNVKQIISQGENVVVIWDGVAAAHDGKQYKNSYAWHLILKEGRIIRVTAFLDTWSLAELMR